MQNTLTPFYATYVLCIIKIPVSKQHVQLGNITTLYNSLSIVFQRTPGGNGHYKDPHRRWGSPVVTWPLIQYRPTPFRVISLHYTSGFGKNSASVCTHIKKKTRWHCDLLKVSHHSIFVNKMARGITGEGWWLLRAAGSAETPCCEHTLHAMSGFNHFHPHQLYQSSLACWHPLHYSAMLFSVSGMAENDGFLPLNRDGDMQSKATTLRW